MNLNFLRKCLILILLAVGWAIPIDAEDAVTTVLDGNGKTIATYTKDREALKKAIILTGNTAGDKFTIRLSNATLSPYSTNFNSGKDITLQLYNSTIILDNPILVTTSSKLTIVKESSNYSARIIVANGTWLNNMVFVQDGSELTIKGADFESNCSNVFDITGKSRLNIQDGSHTSLTYVAHAASGSIIEISGGKFDSSSDLFCLEGGSEMTIHGGVFKSVRNVFTIYSKSKLTMYKGKVTTAKNVVNASDNCDIAISGESFCTDSGLLPYLASDYRIMSVLDDDCPYWVVPSNTTAAIYDKSNKFTGRIYPSVISALNSITDVSKDPVTVKMVKNEIFRDTGDAIKTGSGTRVTLDLNGYTFSKYYGLTIKGLTNLTIIDSSEGKTGEMRAPFATTDLEGMFDIAEGAQLKIEDGKFVASQRFITNSGKLDIYGGKFSFVRFTGGDNTINIYGGYFEKGSNNVSNNDWEYYIAKEGGYVKAETGIENFPYMVGVGGARIGYGELQTYACVINKSMTIDLKDDESDYSAWLAYIYPVISEATNDIDFTIKKYFANTNWHAFFAPLTITMTPDLLHDFEFAEIWDTELNPTDNSTSIEFMKLSEGDIIPAYTPCLVRAKSAGKKDMVFKGVSLVEYDTSHTRSYWIDCSTVDQKFTFCGVMDNANVNGKYALDSENNALVYVQNEDALVTPLKFYMRVEDKKSGNYVPNAKTIMRVIGNDATSIDIIAGKPNGKTVNGDVFNLQGVKVASSTAGLPAGIYIQNGKKLIIK